MRRYLLFLALCALPAEAQICPGASTGDIQYAQEAITISSTALPFTVATYADGGAPVKYAVVTLETNPIRVRADGLNPTATVGELYTNSTNVKFLVCGQGNVQRFRAIRTGSDAAITAAYYR